MKNFLKNIIHKITWPFLALGILLNLKSAKSKVKEYTHNPSLFSKLERYELAYKACKKALKLFNVKLVEKNFDNIPRRPVLFVGNHKSDFDPIILIKLLFEKEGYPFFNFISKLEVKKDKLAGNVATLIDSIYIDRKNPRDFLKVLEQAKNKLTENSVIIFPEGTRIRDKKIGDMKSATLESAYQAMVPIVPFVIYGSEKCKLEGEKRPNYKYKEIIIEFLPQIKPKDFINTNRDFLMEKIKNQISKKYLELDAEKNS